MFGWALKHLRSRRNYHGSKQNMEERKLIRRKQKLRKCWSLLSAVRAHLLHHVNNFPAYRSAQHIPTSGDKKLQICVHIMYIYIYIVYIAYDILYIVKIIVYLQLHVYVYECGNEIHVCIQNKTHQQHISQKSVRQGFNRVLIGFAPISISPALAPASARPKIWSKKWVTVRLGPFSWVFFHREKTKP